MGSLHRVCMAALLSLWRAVRPQYKTRSSHFEIANLLAQQRRPEVKIRDITEETMT